MFRLRSKVKITSEPKADGRYNYGIVIGIELMQNGSYLGYKDEKEFFKRYDGKNVKYTVAYVDCFTNRACVRTFYNNQLEKK